MNVYLLPVGADSYELYCEVQDTDEGVVSEAETPRGLFARLRAYFVALRREAERHGPDEADAVEPSGWLARLKARGLRWVAEAIAEQRLLWHLRKQTSACLLYPADQDEDAAMACLRAQLTRDLQKHRFWLVVDSIGFVASGVLALIPGPNVIAYYLGFRVFGHYLSWQGASRGLTSVTWTTESSAVLSELRSVIDLDPEARAPRVDDLAGRLRLQHLATFVERTAPRPRAA